MDDSANSQPSRGPASPKGRVTLSRALLVLAAAVGLVGIRLAARTASGGRRV